MPNYTHSIAVLIDTGDNWGRSIVEAVARYAQKNRWALILSPRDVEGRLRLPDAWKGDGAIVMLRDSLTAQHIRDSGIPAVDVENVMVNETWLGRVVTDDQVRSQLAFDHFRSRNFAHFAYYAPPINRYPDRRLKIFQRLVEEAGFSCHGFGEFRQDQLSWNVDFEQVTSWIRSLPGPLAIYSPDPYPARQISDICQWEGIHVPDEVAILSGDTDDLLCSIASPPISSIELDCAGIAQEACRLLENLMRGETVPQESIRVSPLRVIPRHSTEVLAVADPVIADVIRFIRSRACEGIRVPDILRAFPVSRRSLEQRFRKTLNRSLSEEIRRTRLEHARNMLLESRKSVAEVAEACNFSSSSELAHAFRKYLGIKPTSLRDRS
ncbi:substrate-binding domain-containing protein [Planctomicrobium sp. SH664]|uniref:AraC family transcriptional regulator n=1 Tax=Planctomicrobium sp. SH664 TaxID=3448125 RepID=UPI003F5AFBDE